jgi:hypothetical protein
MGICTILKRFVFYGGITLLLAGPPIYHAAYRRGIVESHLKLANVPVLERIANDAYVTSNPETHKKYVIDFKNQTVQPYSYSKIQSNDDKRLEELFK